MFLNRPVKLNIKATATKEKVIDPKNLDFEYRVAIANFSSRIWDWFGPYSADQSIELNSTTIRQRYLSPTSKLHYVIVVAQNAKGQSIGASVVTTQTDSSPTAFATLPLYSSVKLIHVGQNIEDLSVKRTSALSGDQELTLVWMHKQVLFPDDNITEYEVYANEVGTKSPFLIGTKASPGADGMVTFKVISDVLPAEQSKFVESKSYTFFLKSKNAQGYARRSTGETITIPSVMPPTGLTASTTNPTAIELNWKKSTGATGYKVYRDNQSASIVTLGDENKFLDTPAADGKEHSYWVVALKDKEESGFSIGAKGNSQLPDEPMPTPKNVTASTDLIGRILITWDAVPGADSYRVVVDGVLTEGPFGSMSNKYLDVQVYDLSEHTYEVRTISKTRPYSAFSAPVKGKMLSMGGSIPEVTVASATYNETDGVHLSWDKVPGASYYLIYGYYLGHQMQYEIALNATTYLDIYSVAIPGDIPFYVLFALTDTEKSLAGYGFSGSRLPVLDAYEPNDTLLTAKPLLFNTSSQSLTGTINHSMDEDWFSFEAVKDETYNFYTLSDTSSQIFTYNKDGEIIQQDYYFHSINDNGYISFKAPSTETYYIKISSIDGRLNQYYFVYNKGDALLIPPDMFCSKNRIDGVLITFNQIPGAEGYHIYRDNLKAPVKTLLSSEKLEYLDSLPDTMEHNYWIVSYKGTNLSAYSAFGVGQKFELDSYEPDNDSASAKLLTPTASVKSQDRSFAPGADKDYLQISAVKDTVYNFWSISGMDTYITIFDSAMKSVASNDDSGLGYNFSLAFIPAATALYYIEIKAFSSEAAGNYKFYYTTSPGIIFESRLNATFNLDTGINLSWTLDPNADGYRIYRDSYDNKIADVGKVSKYSDVTISDFLPHKYWLQPFNAIGDFPYSSPRFGQKVGKDSFEDDGGPAKTKTITLTSTVQTQKHSFYPDSDEDWYKFDALKDSTNIFIIKNLMGYQVVLKIFDSDGITELYSVTANKLIWQPTKDATYYLKTTFTDTKTYGWVDMYYYSPTDSLPIAKPTNLKATTDKSDYIELTWDPVPNATMYAVYLDGSSTSPFGSFTTSCKYVGTNYKDHSFTVSATFAVGGEVNNNNGIEGLKSDPAIGHKVRHHNSSWTNEPIDLLPNVKPTFGQVILSSGIPALIYNDAGNNVRYSYSSSTLPNKDWNSYILFAGPYYGMNMQIIDGKPAFISNNGVNLYYTYSKIASPTVAGDWVQLKLTVLSNGEYNMLALIDNKPAIIYVNGTSIYYIMSKTTIPVDGKPASWEAPVLIDSADGRHTIGFVPNASTGAACVAYTNGKGYLSYAYSNKLIPANLSDWSMLSFSEKSMNPSLIMLNGFAAISYIEASTTNLMLKTTTTATPISEWTNSLVDSNANPTGRTNIILRKDLTPAIIFTDVQKYPRVAKTSSKSPSLPTDWIVNVLDTEQTYTSTSQLVEGDKLFALYLSDFDHKLYFLTNTK